MNENVIEKLLSDLQMGKEMQPFVAKSIPRMLPGESELDYVNLLVLLVEDVDPQTNIEWLLLLDIASIMWEIHRYRRWKNAILYTGRKAAVATAFAKVHRGNLVAGSGSAIRAEAKMDAEAWHHDSSKRAALDAKLANGGYDADAINAEAFMESLLPVNAIENLLLSARRQVTGMLREIGVRREFALRARETIDKLYEEKIAADEEMKVIENKSN
ncbi:MAG: hypothetical protein ACTHNN_01520 [Xanthobacteraceae bacterium]